MKHHGLGDLNMTNKTKPKNYGALNFIHICIKKEGKLEAPLLNVLFWGVALNVQKNGKQSYDGPIKVAPSKQNKTKQNKKNCGPMHPHHVKLNLVR